MAVGGQDKMAGGREPQHTQSSAGGRAGATLRMPSEVHGSAACMERDLPTMMCKADVSESFVPTV